MYIYCADVWCDDCGKSIAEALDKQGKADTGETDDYPQYANEDGETDSPSHCASREDCFNAEVLSDGSKVGCLLQENLTDYGRDYVRDAISDGGPVAELWAERFSDCRPDDDDDDDDANNADNRKQLITQAVQAWREWNKAVIMAGEFGLNPEPTGEMKKQIWNWCRIFNLQEWASQEWPEYDWLKP